MFLDVFQDVFLMMMIVIVLEKVIAGKVAKNLASRFIDPQIDKPIFMILAIQCFTVCLMSPMMSLVATLMFKNLCSEVISIWIQTVVFNFPLAFFWQIFFAGPLVRFIFRLLFIRNKQLH